MHIKNKESLGVTCSEFLCTFHRMVIDLENVHAILHNLISREKSSPLLFEDILAVANTAFYCSLRKKNRVFKIVTY